jgi:hypothetical protein
LGFFLGGLVGFVASIIGGSRAGASVGSQMSDWQKERAQVRSLLMPEVKSYLQRLRESRIGDLEIARLSALQRLEQSVREHTLEYSGVVNQMLEEHTRKMNSLADQERQAQMDSAELLKRTEQLDETRDRLLALGS